LSRVIKNNQYINADSYKILAQTQAQALAAEVVSSQQEALSDELEQQRLRLFQQEEELLEQQNQLAQLRQNLLEEVEYMKAEAQQEIERWWEQRRAEDTQVVEQARQDAALKGKEEGLQDGIKEARKKTAATITEAVQALEQAMHVKQQLIAEAEPAMVELSVMIAQKLIQKQLTLQPDWIVGLVKEHLKRKSSATAVTILVSPQQFPIVYAARDVLMACLDPMAELLVVPDQHVQDHGCIIRTPSGNMDCTVDTQLKAIRDSLTQVAREVAANGSA
jgi:flagellar assembly protein FliH